MTRLYLCHLAANIYKFCIHLLPYKQASHTLFKNSPYNDNCSLAIQSDCKIKEIN